MLVDEGGLRIVLRPSAGPDLELYPNLAGFGSLLEAGVTELLPIALNEVASMTGDAVRAEVADLVGRAGRGLAVASGTPAVFDGTALKALAADPAAYCARTWEPWSPRRSPGSTRSCSGCSASRPPTSR